MAAVEELRLIIRTFGGKAAAGEVSGAEKAVGGLGKTAKLASGLLGVGAIGFALKDVTQSAIKFQQQQNQLANSLAKVHQNTPATVNRLTEASDTLATHGGLDPAQNIQALQRLIDATHNVTTAQRDLGVVTGLVRGGYGGYTAILRAVMNVEQGRTTGLGRLAIVMKPTKAAQDALATSTKHATLAQKEHAKAIDAAASKHAALARLMELAKGRTEAYSRSAAGAASNFKNTLEVLQQRFGKALLPIITKVLQALTKILANKAAVYGIVGIIGLLAAGWAILAIHAAAAAVAENAALLGIPAAIALVVAGIVLLVTHFKAVKTWVVQNFPIIAAAIALILGPFGLIIDAVLFVIMHFKTFKSIAIGVFNVVKSVAISVFNVLKTVATIAFTAIKVVFDVFLAYWKVGFAVAKFVAQLTFAILLALAKVAFAAIKAVVMFFFNNVWKPAFNVAKAIATTVFGVVSSVATTAFGIVSSVANTAWDVIKAIFNWIKGAWQTVAGFLAAPFHALAGVVQGVFDGVKNAIVGAINWLIDAYNNTLGQLPFAPHIDHIGGGADPSSKRVKNPYTGGTALADVARHPAKAKAVGGPISESGYYDVGEQGKERVWLPRGAAVQPNTSQPLENHTTIKIGPKTLLDALHYSIAQVKATS